MPFAADLDNSLDGEVLRPRTTGYDTARRPVNPVFHDVRPQAVVRARSVEDVVKVVRHARATGTRVVARGGGHCFAGRSSTDGIVLDTSVLDDIRVHWDGTATIGAGARLGRVYRALQAHGLTLPAGCGPTVGITGLALGGGIGQLGRRHGLTCDRMVGARIVLADGSVVDCDDAHEPDLFWGLRGAGGGQLGIVTSLRLATVSEPQAVRVELDCPEHAPDALLAAWQHWSPDAPDEVSVSLTLASEPDGTVRTRLFGASLLAEETTREVLGELVGTRAAARATRPAEAYHRVKATLADSRDAVEPIRLRSELFDRAMARSTVDALLHGLREPRAHGRRQVTVTPMGGAYDRVAGDATAFAHRGMRFLLEHVGTTDDPWVDASWTTAHAEASGHVYANFPDPALEDGPLAYHHDHLPRLRAIKHAYDPGRFFDFPHSI